MPLKDLLISSLPEYSEKIISDKQISFRPMIVSEEKGMLLALQTDNKETIIKTLAKTIAACLNTNKDWTIPEFEHIFLLLRMKSIGELEGFVIKCPQTQEEVTVKVDLTKQIRTIKNKINNKVKINDNLIVVFKEPTVKTLLKYPNYKTSTDEMYGFIAACVKHIQNQKEIIDCSETPEKEVIEFIQNLSSSQFKDVLSYFNSLPKVQVFSTYQTSDGVTREITIEGLFEFISFFLTI